MFFFSFSDGGSVSLRGDEQFATYDHDNDENLPSSCGLNVSGGWWYHDCSSCNPNGPYFKQENQKGIICDNVKVKTIELKIKP